MKRTRTMTAFLAPLTWCSTAAFSHDLAVDFGYRPPQWRTAICFPDDPHKTLVNEKGDLLYHWNHGRPGEFGTQVSVVVDDQARLTGQMLVSPRVPIVRTLSRTGDLSIVQEVFATRKPGPALSLGKYTAERKDRPLYQRNWARPQPGVTDKLSTIDLDGRKPIHYQIRVPTGAAVVIAIGLCEGWHDKPGQRILDLSVEGARPQVVDPVAALGKNVAGVFWFTADDANRDGLIDLMVAPTKEAPDKNAILNGFWVFDTKPIEDDATLLSGRLDAQAALVYYAGQVDNDSRNDIVLVHVTNQGNAAHAINPKLVITTALDTQLNRDGRIHVDHHEMIASSLKPESVSKKKVETGEQSTAALASLTVEPGKTAAFAVAWCGGGRIDTTPLALADAVQARQQAEAFWKNANLPYDRIKVPDPNIQALIDSSIRNIWQAREIKNGLPCFQVGATCYRFLFIVDGAFILEAASLVGAGRDTRAGIAYTLTFQQDDGRFEILPHYSKENGIVLWTCVRHAMLTQDKEWLRSIWPQLEKTVAFIRRLRDESRQDASPLNDGLMPAGYVDGGINSFDQLEYSNVYWNLVGLKAIVQAAHWIGKEEEAHAWQAEYDDFYATFRKAAERDLRTDEHGNRYLRILMTDDEKLLKSRNAEWYLPCKGQWTFCHAVYPGQLFAKTDPLVKGNLDMLAAYEKEGLITTTGWLTGGIWNYFASFSGHAFLWQGDGRKAAETLYAFANHASPLYAWLEEQGLKGEPTRENGDMPHNWASAEFIRLAVHLLALDRGNELHLFEGLPREWTGPGMATQLNRSATPFGDLTCTLSIAADGKSASLKVEPLSDASCQMVVVHLGGWASRDPNATLTLDPRKSNEVAIPIHRP